MAEFRITRESTARMPRCNPYFMVMFDLIVKQQDSGEPDMVFPDGWTELHSIFLYQREPSAHQWLMTRGLIPKDRVADLFPEDLRGKQLRAYVLPKLPSEMTADDWKRVARVGHL